jgi:hypothetical protein
MGWISLGPVVNTANHLQHPDWADTSQLSEALNYDLEFVVCLVFCLKFLHFTAKTRENMALMGRPTLQNHSR